MLRQLILVCANVGVCRRNAAQQHANHDEKGYDEKEEAKTSQRTEAKAGVWTSASSRAWFMVGGIWEQFVFVWVALAGQQAEERAP